MYVYIYIYFIYIYIYSYICIYHINVDDNCVVLLKNAIVGYLPFFDSIIYVQVMYIYIYILLISHL